MGLFHGYSALLRAALRALGNIMWSFDHGQYCVWADQTMYRGPGIDQKRFLALHGSFSSLLFAGGLPFCGRAVYCAKCMTGDREAVRSAATDFGIALDEDAIEAYAAEIADTREQFAGLRSSSPEGERATDVHEAADGYNAFYRRCTLAGASGPLSTLSVAVKDNIAVAGVPMTCGSAAVEFTPEYSATVIRRLADHGAEIVGTTNMDEFAYFTTGETCAHGPVDNPTAEGCVPGGSSAGSAAAVAADLVDVALGSDTGGSIRIPASFCGVVGFKPTHRTVPRFGFADLAPSLDHIGPLAKSVETAAITLDAIVGPTAEDPGTLGIQPPTELGDEVGEGIADLDVGVITEAMDHASDGVVAAVRNGIGAIENAGATVKDVSIPGFVNAPISALGIVGPEFAQLLKANGQVYGTGTGYSEPWRAAVASMTESGGYGENVRDQLLIGSGVDLTTSGAVYVAAQTVRRELTSLIDQQFQNLDALIAPTTPIPAPEFGAVSNLEAFIQTFANTVPFNLTGHPALSVPCGTTERKPVGLQVVADRLGEPIAVRIGSVVEAEEND